MTHGEHISEIILDAEYVYYGLRIEDGRVLEVGSTAPRSRAWWDEELTGEYLEGACAVQLREGLSPEEYERLALDSPYWGEYVVLLGSHRATLGEDLGEIIMIDAKVLYVGRRPWRFPQLDEAFWTSWSARVKRP